MKSPSILLALALLAPLAHAASYHVSAISGDDARTSVEAQNPATPWKSIDKLNSFNLSLRPGDAVLFKRGESHQGSLSIRSSGTSASVITYGAFGSGANPTLSGFTAVGNWRLEKPGVYSAPLDAQNLSMVTINGEAKGMGRYPNTGFLRYEGASGNSSITDNELPASPSWADAEIVVRKYRFILDRHVVTSHVGSTLFYSAGGENGNNSAFSPVKGNGYFIQNHLNTLDQFGEWYHDPVAKRLYVFFGANSPTSHVVNASTRATNATVSGASFLRFESLDFEGGNTRGLSLATASNITLQNVNFWNQGGSSLYGVDTDRVAVNGGSIHTSFSNGVNFEHNAFNTTIDGVAVYNSNMIPGSGRSGSGSSIGITVNGGNTRIVNNRVIGSGYSGIQFMGDNVVVDRNVVDTSCTLKDDGGGIYTYTGASDANSYNRKITNNIILNAVGAYAGAEAYSYEAFGKCAGIYLDEHVNNVEVSGNTIAHGDWGGIFLHNAHDNLITRNVIYNHRYQVHVSQYSAATRNNTMTANQYVAKQPFQSTFYYRTFVVDSPATMGVFDNNVYARPINDSGTIQIDSFYTGGNGTAYATLDQWKSAYRLDASSRRAPLTFTSNIDANMRFEYNDTAAPKVVVLETAYTDLAGKVYSGSVTVNPFTSVVLLKGGVAATNASQTITFGSLPYKTWGAAPFDLAATASSGLPVQYRVVSGPISISGRTVTILDVGTAYIEATQPGNTSYAAATPVTRGFTIGKGGQTITFPSIANTTFGAAPFALAATASSGLPVAYQVVSGPAVVAGNVVTLTGRGTVSIKALQPGDKHYAEAWAPTRSFTVQ